MKRVVSLYLFCLPAIILLTGCASVRHKATVINWPASIDYMEAICELNISWKDVRYSGEMSLKLDYPGMLHAEVYGPFGDTLVSIERDNSWFLMKAGGEETRDEKRFLDVFHMSTEDFMNDITFRGDIQHDSNGVPYIQREHYRVLYHLDGPEYTMRWISPEGTICIKFLEVNFDKGQPIGKGSNRDM